MPSNYILTPEGNFLSTDELYHYGVLGMKWGVRRYQNSDGSLTAAGKVRYAGTDSKAASDTSDNRDHSKSDKTPLAWFATSAAVHIMQMNPVGLATDAARLVQAGADYVKDKKYTKEREGSSVDDKTGFSLKKREMTVQEDSARVNPLVHNFDNNTKNNCMLCTSAYDLRRRGYDVKAKKASSGYFTEELLAWYPKAKINKVTGINEKGKPSTKDMTTKLKSELVKQGDGARGNLMIKWAGTRGGHSVAYEVTNGSLRIIDAQINKIYDNPDRFLRRCTNEVEYARLDNVSFNLKTIKEVAE